MEHEKYLKKEILKRKGGEKKKEKGDYYLFISLSKASRIIESSSALYSTRAKERKDPVHHLSRLLNYQGGRVSSAFFSS